MTRRGFFGVLAAVALGRPRSVFDASEFVWPAASGSVTGVSVFAFHPDAFSLVGEAFDIEEYVRDLPEVEIVLGEGVWVP